MTFVLTIKGQSISLLLHSDTIDTLEPSSSKQLQRNTYVTTAVAVTFTAHQGMLYTLHTDSTTLLERVPNYFSTLSKKANSYKAVETGGA